MAEGTVANASPQGARNHSRTAISPRASSINMPDEDFTSIEAALQASRSLPVVSQSATRKDTCAARWMNSVRPSQRKKGLSQRSIGCCAAYDVWMTPVPPDVAAILGASRLRSIASLTPFRKSCCRR